MTQSIDSRFTLHQGNNIDVLKGYPDNHFDSVVTDPPYGIDFLGKAWDSNTGSVDTYKECLRVLKPGGHLLAFSAARTYHHLAMSVELAGFEIRDQIMWIYGSGFPKSQDVGRSIERSMNKAQGKKNKISKLVDTTKNAGFGQTDHARIRAGVEWSTTVEEVGQVECTHTEAKQWSGWGTALKPAHEPIVVARKPAKLSIAKNVQVYGTGAINIDACRVGDFVPTLPSTGTNVIHRELEGNDEANAIDGIPDSIGRFPSNVLGELGEYQKYFYCPKVSRKERHAGYDPNSQGVVIDSEVFGKTPICNDCGKTRNGSTKHDQCDPANISFEERRTQRSEEVGNNHPTVKPQQLMEYLIRLVTPPGSKVLDPFNGSGSTGMAAVKLGHHYTGIDLDERYIEISEKRITAWNEETNNFQALFDETTK